MTRPNFGGSVLSNKSHLDHVKLALSLPRRAIPFSFILFVQSSAANASSNYEFCITRVGAGTETFGARYKFGDIDPGKEVARVLVSQKYKQADTTSVSVADYNVARCGEIREEANVTMTAEQLKTLGEAIGRGDPVGTAVAAGEILTGVTVKTVQSVGKAISDGVRWIGCRLGIGC